MVGSKMLQKCSDSKCTCTLRLGVSEAFKMAQKSVNVIKDPIESIFNTPEQQKILQKRTQGMSENYGDVEDGTKASVTCYPSGFNFDSRIKKFNTVVIQKLEGVRKNLENNPPNNSKEADAVAQNLTNMVPQSQYLGTDVKKEIDQAVGLSDKAKKELTKKFRDCERYDEKSIKEKINLVVHETEIASIKTFLKTIKPQDSERMVLDGIISLFSNERGLILHSMTTDVFLQVFVDEARRDRKTNQPGLSLTPLELQIANALSLTNDELNKASNEVLNDLQKRGMRSPYSNKDVQKSIMDNKKFHTDLKTKAKGHFAANSSSDTQFIKDALKLSTYEHESKFPGELDLLGIFPDLQLLFHVEVKSNQSENKKNDNNLSGAAKQMARYAEHISKRHGSVLSNNWSYLKVASIIPGVTNIDQVCSHCKRFLLTQDQLANEKTLRLWWESLGLYRNPGQDIATRSQCYREFLNLFNRTVNLSSIVRKTNVFHTWEQIQGSNSRPIVAGITPAPSTDPSSLSFKDVINRAHDAFKALYFTPEQMALLIPGKFLRLILFADYGAGNKFKNIQYKYVDNIINHGILFLIPMEFFVSMFCL